MMIESCMHSSKDMLSLRSYYFVNFNYLGLGLDPSISVFTKSDR